MRLARLLLPLLGVTACGDSDAPTEPARAATVTVTAARVVLEPGDSVRVTAEGRSASGGVVANVSVAWSSSDSDVATVTAAGWVHARAGGTATISGVATGSRAPDTGAPSGSLLITVQPLVRRVVVSAPETLATGDSVLLHAVAYDGAGTPMPEVTFAWASTDASIGTVQSTGAFAAHRRGTVTVTATPTGPSEVLAGSSGPSGSARIAVRLVLAQLTAGSYHTCGVARGGAVHCWGEGAWGRLGTGVSYGAWKTVPLPTAAVTDVRFAAVEGDGQQDSRSGHTCGVAADGAAYCWGSGAWGMLGDGRQGEDIPPHSTAVPARVAGVPAVRQVALGGSHSCLLAESGESWCAGGNYSGEIGAPATSASCDGAPCVLTFTQVSADRFRSLVAGTHHNCGLTDAGEARCWGSGGFGALGTGRWDDSPVPTAVAGGHRFTSLGSGGLNTCGIAVDGATYCWGSTYFGQGGSGAHGSDLMTLVPTRVASPAPFASVYGGKAAHTCALTADGTAYCWGANESGELGAATSATCGIIPREGETYSTAPCSATPVAVSTSLRFTSLALGASHTCGLTSDGAAYCWGANHNGQLGTGDTGRRTAPARVVDVP